MTHLTRITCDQTTMATRSRTKGVTRELARAQMTLSSASDRPAPLASNKSVIPTLINQRSTPPLVDAPQLSTNQPQVEPHHGQPRRDASAARHRIAPPHNGQAAENTTRHVRESFAASPPWLTAKPLSDAIERLHSSPLHEWHDHLDGAPIRQGSRRESMFWEQQIHAPPEPPPAPFSKVMAGSMNPARRISNLSMTSAASMLIPATTA